MATDENSRDVGSPPRWWSAITNASARVPLLLRVTLVLPLYLTAVIVAIDAGTHMFVAHWPNGDAENKFRGIYDGPYDPAARFPDPADRANFLRSALAQDRWVILGYFLVLITCAVVFAVLVFSKTGKKLSHIILAAVLVATFADLLERRFIYHMLDAHRSGPFGRLPDVFWIRGAEAMATIKWCALVVAVAAIP